MIARAQYKPEPVCECGFTVPQEHVDRLNELAIMYVDSRSGSWQMFGCGQCGRTFQTRSIALFYVYPPKDPAMIPIVLLDIDEGGTTLEDLQLAAKIKGNFR